MENLDEAARDAIKAQFWSLLDVEARERAAEHAKKVAEEEAIVAKVLALAPAAGWLETLGCVGVVMAFVFAIPLTVICILATPGAMMLDTSLGSPGGLALSISFFGIVACGVVGYLLHCISRCMVCKALASLEESPA